MINIEQNTITSIIAVIRMIRMIMAKIVNKIRRILKDS